ncbi:MAG: teichoic acid D-Ala incorporation-associated protein DltX [Anaerolineales bacterium]|nr:teichoic acid D-Ala incorporation-associated protein DltX [Anaerolineales bacterium]MCZ2122619.1 teichoic acid D-Ala incorporation-associated protein DltX [Anaerolineales bacterium]
MTFIITASNSYWGKTLLLAAYYFAIIVALILMYGKGNFEPAEFIYQGY